MRASLNSGMGIWRFTAGPLLRQRLAAAAGWWLGELGQLVPQRLRGYILERRRKIYLMPSGNQVTVLEGTPGQLTNRGTKPLDTSGDLLLMIGDGDQDVVLLLPPELLLRRSITLPSGVGEDLASVLALEMDRQTPFTADQVYFDFVVRERSSVTKTICVDLLLTPKARLDPLLSQLASAAVLPVAVSGLDSSGELLQGNVLPRERRPQRRRVFGPLNTVLSIAALLLLVAAGAIPILKKQSAIEALEPQVAAAMDAAREGSAIRQNIELLTTGTTALIDRKRAEPTAIRLLDEVTRAIPDHTWIEQVEIHGPEVQLRGQSPSAAAMIALFESSALFDDPQFRSPVTQVSNSSQERFHISVRWAGGEP